MPSGLTRQGNSSEDALLLNGLQGRQTAISEQRQNSVAARRDFYLGGA